MFDFLFDLIPQFRRVPDLLPWLAYDDETRTFVCDGNYIGFTFSAMPMSGFEDTMEKRFRSLLNFEFPQGTFLQFNLMVFDDVSRHISDLRQARAGTDDHLINTATAKTVEFITRGAMGGGELPVRNATLLLSVKLPTAADMPTEIARLADRASAASLSSCRALSRPARASDALCGRALPKTLSAPPDGAERAAVSHTMH